VESELSFKAVVCSTYESLLQRCMATFEVWASFTYHGNGAKDSKLLHVRDLPTETERPRAR